VLGKEQAGFRGHELIMLGRPGKSITSFPVVPGLRLHFRRSVLTGAIPKAAALSSELSARSD
jgi:hypothetical protein